MKYISLLNQEINHLDHEDLNDQALLAKLSKLSEKLTSFLKSSPEATVQENNRAGKKMREEVVADTLRKEERQASRLLHLESWYRDRSSLPEVKLVQFVGEENPKGIRKYYRFRDHVVNSFNLDAHGVLRKMEPAA